MNIWKVSGLTTLSLAGIMWISPVFNNKDLFPETRICFRPKQILNEKNQHLSRCDSNERVTTILSSVFHDLDKKDIEFSSKVASDEATRHFDSNLQQTKYLQFGAFGLGIVSLCCFSKLESDRKANRNIAYHKRRSDYVLNELVTNEHLHPQRELNAAEIEMQAESILRTHNLKMSEADKQISENKLEIAKNIRDINKIRGKNSSSDESRLKPHEELINSMMEALKQHEDGWLNFLVESFTPIIVYGKAGSYKSYTAACLALLKHYLINAKIESIADVDFKQNKDASWKYLVPLEPNVYGSGIDWEDYGQAYLDAIERSKTRTLKDSPIVSIWDELTNAKGKFDNAPNIIPFVIATPRKRNEHCILISHGLTQDNLGGCESISEPIKTQTYRLNLKTNPMGKPLFKGNLNGLVDSEGEELEDKKITLPKWFRPETIHGHFNGKPIDFS